MFKYFSHQIHLEFVRTFILSLGLYILPESPKYLILKGREEEAKKLLSRLLSILIKFIFYYGTTFFKNSVIQNAFTIMIITNVS
ncbi:hypothetical protein PtB15_1B765 [Puccinia triticina]|nr:hypothetical protein PtB15_1B765 [Puccinia triticina]